MLIPLPTLTRLTRPNRLFLAMMSVAASSPCCISSSCAAAALLPLSLGFVHRRAVHLPSRKFDQVAKSVVAENNDDGGASDAGDGSNTGYQISVTGTVYELEGAPTVKLFTKQGCTLCDRVKDVSTIILEGIGVTLVLLRYHNYFHIIHSPYRFLPSTHLPPCLFGQSLESVREVQPHSLHQVDITDDDKQEWFSRYKLSYSHNFRLISY